MAKMVNNSGKYELIISGDIVHKFAVYEIHDATNGVMLFSVYGPMASVAVEAAMRTLEKGGSISSLAIFERFPTP